MAKYDAEINRGKMTFDEFLAKCREADGWKVEKGWEVDGYIRNSEGHCRLEAVFGSDYHVEGRRAGLNVYSIIDGADGNTNGPYRKALLTLIKETP